MNSFKSILILGVLGISGISGISLSSAHASDVVTTEAVTVAESTYQATARYERPLDTFERCDSGSEPGIQAKAAAESEALLDCRDEFNSDCLVIGTEYQELLSDDFIGYKACEATVTVHGYRTDF